MQVAHITTLNFLPNSLFKLIKISRIITDVLDYSISSIKVVIFAS